MLNLSYYFRWGSLWKCWPTHRNVWSTFTPSRTLFAWTIGRWLNRSWLWNRRSAGIKVKMMLLLTTLYCSSTTQFRASFQNIAAVFSSRQCVYFCLCSIFRCLPWWIALFPSWSKQIALCATVFLQWLMHWTQCSHFWSVTLKILSLKLHLDPSLTQPRMQKRWSPNWTTCIYICTISMQSWNNLVGTAKNYTVRWCKLCTYMYMISGLKKLIFELDRRKEEKEN